MPAGDPPISFNRLVRLLITFTVAVLLLRLAIGLFTGGEGGSAAPSPSASPSRVEKSPQRELPRCSRDEKRVKLDEYTQWASSLLDTSFALKSSYEPPDLVSVEQAGFDGEFSVRRLMIEDLDSLRAAAETAGNPVDIAAAYRSYIAQDSLYRRRVQTEGVAVAKAKTALPGHSEHQLGTTVDFKTAGQLDVDAAWESTPAGKWMAKEAWKYGFVMSYPAGESRATCYWYEPWHYRYFGVEKAREIHGSDLTVREFLWEEMSLE